MTPNRQTQTDGDDALDTRDCSGRRPGTSLMERYGCVPHKGLLPQRQILKRSRVAGAYRPPCRLDPQSSTAEGSGAVGGQISLLQMQQIRGAPC
jgi:hypothetical protein